MVAPEPGTLLTRNTTVTDAYGLPVGVGGAEREAAARELLAASIEAWEVDE